METTLLKTDTRDGYARAVKAAAGVLDVGGIVAVPTETVYGLAASAEHPKAIERLRDIKKRPDEKKFTICLGLKTDVRRFAADVPRTARKLINRYWPGPLTLVLPGGRSGTVGLRMPALSFTRDVLLEVDTTVVIPSANPHGEDPARTAGEVMGYFDGAIELVVDGGPSPLGTASSVVEITADGGMNILRRGAIGEDELRKATVHTILFICTGNMCRSPMAEGIARDRLAKALGVAPDDLEEAGFRVTSAGTGTFGGSRPSPEAVEVMRDAGIDISRYLSQPLTPELAQEADDIYVMAPNHLDALRAIDGDAAARARLVSSDARTIEDPIGQPKEVYRAVRDALFEAVQERLRAYPGRHHGGGAARSG